jgi:cytochrome P450
LTSIVYNLYLHPLAHVPGPFWARASGIPSWYHALTGKRHIWLWQQFQIYGHKIRVAPNLVLFADPQAYGDIYGQKSNVRRSHFYTAFRRNEHDATTLNTVDIAEHAAKRKLLNLCFTENTIRASSKFIINHIDRWIDLMIQENDTPEWSEAVDFSGRLDRLIFDIMGDISFGKSFDIKEPGENPLKSIPHSIAEYMRFYYPVRSGRCTPSPPMA